MDKAAKLALTKYGEHMVDPIDLDKSVIQITCDFPIIRADDIKPKSLLTEKECIKLVKEGGDTDGVAMHFFVPDYKLDAIENKFWTGLATLYAPHEMWEGIAKFKGQVATETYIERKWESTRKLLDFLKQFEAVCSLEHSVYANWSNPRNVMNVARNRTMGRQLQKEGIRVIPSLNWSGERTFEYAFLGVEPGGTYAISAIGTGDNHARTREESLYNYRKGVKHLVQKLSPIRLIVYGSGELPDADYGNCEVMYFRNQQSLKANESYRKGEK